MWPFKKSAEQLYKEKESARIVEAIKSSAIIIKGTAMECLGLSVYGAEKMLAQGREPEYYGEKVLLENGELVSWEEWKEGKL